MVAVCRNVVSQRNWRWGSKGSYIQPAASETEYAEPQKQILTKLSVYNCLHYFTFSLFETQHFNTKLPSTT